MKIFKLSLLEIKKQKLSFILFLIISIVFFVASIFIFNFNSSLKTLGIAPFIDDEIIVEIDNYKTIKEPLNFKNVWLDNRYALDEIYIDNNEVLISEILLSSDYINFDDDEFEISTSVFEIGEEVNVNYNGVNINAKVVDDYGEREIYFSPAFEKYSKCNTLSIEVTKENNTKLIDLYNNYQHLFTNTGVDKYIRFVSATSTVCVVLTVFTIMALCLIIWNFISYLINNNRKQIAINLAIGYKRRDIMFIYCGVIFLLYLISFIISILLGILILNLVNKSTIYKTKFDFGKSIIIIIITGIIQMLLMMIKYKRIFKITIASEIKEVL